MKQTKIRVEPVGVCDTDEVGNWTKYYPFIRLGYRLEGYRGRYSDTAFYAKDGDGIQGYYMAYSIVNTDSEDIIPLYSKKMVLYDFAVAARAYARYGTRLISHMIEHARRNGYCAIELPRVEGYAFFFSFMARHYPLTAWRDSYYILIDEPHIRVSQRYLRVYEDDRVRMEELYFLHDLQFSVLRKCAKRRFEDGSLLSVDRRSGIIAFPPCVRLLGDAVALNAATRSIVYLICDRYRHGQPAELVVACSAKTPEAFEIYDGDQLYVSRSLPELREDEAYVRSALDKGIRYIFPYAISYDMNDSSFSGGTGGIACSQLLKLCEGRRRRPAGN